MRPLILRPSLLLLCVSLASSQTGVEAQPDQTVPQVAYRHINPDSSGRAEIKPDVAFIDLERRFVVTYGGDSQTEAGNLVGLLGRRVQAGNWDGEDVFLIAPGDCTQAGGEPLSSSCNAPQVASDLSGAFLTVWRDDDSVDQIMYRYYRADGSDTGVRTLLNASDAFFPATSKFRPRVAADLSGEYIIVFEADFNGGPGCVDDAADVCPVGVVFDANTETVGDAFDLDIGSDSAWESDWAIDKDLVRGSFAFVRGGTCPGADSEIMCLSRYSGAGQPLGPPIVLDDQPVGAPGRMGPDVAIDFAGNITASWIADPVGGDAAGTFGELRMRRLGPDGQLQDDQVSVDLTSFQGKKRAKVAARNIKGDLAFLWADSDLGTTLPWQLKMRWFPADFSEPNAPIVNAVTLDEEVEADIRGVFQTVAVDTSLTGDIVIVTSKWAYQSPAPDAALVFYSYHLAPVELQVGDATVAEGTPVLRSSALLTVQASRAHPVPGVSMSVDYSTIDGTATFLTDYERTEDTLVLPPGQSIEVIPLTIFEDETFEADETFEVRLANPSNAIITRESGIVTILNDDQGGQLTVDDVSLAEGGPGESTFFDFEVRLNPAQQVAASVRYQTVSGTANALEDFEPTFGAITFLPDFTTSTVRVVVRGDQQSEDDEQFSLELLEAENAVIAPGSQGMGIGTIENDDCRPFVASPSPLVLPSAPPWIDVSDPEACGWSAEVLTGMDWLRIDGCVVGGSPTDCVDEVGDGRIDISFDATTTNAGLLGSVLVAGEGVERLVNVSQAGLGCDGFEIVPDQIDFPSGIGLETVTVQGMPPDCQWLVSVSSTKCDGGVDTGDASWLEILSSPSCPAAKEGCAHGGVGPGSLVLQTVVNEGLQRCAAVEVFDAAVAVRQSGIFLEHFDNDTLSPQWIYAGDGIWSEQGSHLFGDADDGLSLSAIARPAFSGCVVCTIDAIVEFDVFSRGTITLYGWYLNEENHISLTLDEFSDLWTLRQLWQGDEVATQQIARPASPQQQYLVSLDFDGSRVALEVDGELILNLDKGPGSQPDGTVGFQVLDTVGKVDLVRVVTQTTGNLPGLVTIDSPIDGSEIPEDTGVALLGSAMDPEDGDLSGSIEWLSSLDGALGVGAGLPADLSPGLHLITASIMDSGALPAFESVQVTVLPNLPPLLAINTPSSGFAEISGVPIDFNATAIDDADGDLSASIEWTSDVEGPLGTGGSITVPLSIVGTHVIMASAQDQSGALSEASVTVEIGLDLIFEDGFESGDTTEWSAVEP